MQELLQIEVSPSMKTAPLFATEHEMCESFRASVEKDGWVVYPEIGDYDLVVVRDGVQAGIQAKLRASIKLLAQIVSNIGRLSPSECGPDYLALLVPKCDPDFKSVAEFIGAIIFEPRVRTGWGDVPARVQWGKLDHALLQAQTARFEKPLELPDIVLLGDVRAGTPCPTRLTAWKVRALRLVARLEIRGYVTATDFREIGLHTSRWYYIWLVPEDPGAHSRSIRWVRRTGKRLPDEQHPEAFKTILEREREKVSAEVQSFGCTLPLFGGSHGKAQA